MTELASTPTGTLEQQSQLRFGATQPVPIQGKPFTAQAVAPVAGGSGVAGKSQVGPVDLSLGQADIPSMLGGFTEFANKVMAPKFAEKKKAAMYEGMLRQQAGESIEQLRAEQNPILTWLGQEGGLVEGAKIGASVSGTAKAFADIQADMPRLAEMTTADASAEMQKRFSDAYAGMEDDSVRALAAPQFFETHSALMVQHGKAAVLYKKKQAMQDTITASVDVGSAIQALAPGIKDGTVNSVDQQRAVDGFLEIVDARPFDVSDTEWREHTIGTANGLLNNGNFEGFNALKKSQSWGRLDQEQRDRLMLSEESAHQREATYNVVYQKDATDNNAVEFALTQGVSTFKSEEEVDAWMTQVNVARQQSSGTTALVYNNNDRGRVLNMYRAGLSRAAAANAAAEGDARDAITLKTIYDAGIASQGTSSTKALTGDQMNALSNSLYADLLQEGDPDRQRARLTNFVGAIAANSDYVPDLLKNPLSRDLSALRNGAPLTPSMGSSFAQAKLILAQPNGPKALDNIVGGELSLAYQHVANLGIDFNDPVAMETASKSMRAAAASQPSSDDIARSEEFLGSAMSSMFWKDGSLSEMGITDRGQRTLISRVAPLAARYRKQFPGMTEQEVSQAALSDTVKGGDIVNGMYVPFNIATIKPKRMQTEVAALVGIPNVNTELYVDAQQRAANAQLRLQFRKQAGSGGKAVDEGGFNPEHYEMVSGTAIGGGIVRATYRAKDLFMRPDAPNYTYTITLQPQDVANNYKLARAERTKEQASKGRRAREVNELQQEIGYGSGYGTSSLITPY